MHVHGLNTFLETNGVGWLTWLTTMIPMRLGLTGMKMFQFSLYDVMCKMLSNAWTKTLSCLLRPV